MAVEIESPAIVSCPPHYWLIEKAALHHYHWSCQRCGTEQEHHDKPKLSNHWENTRSQQRSMNSTTQPAAE